MCKGFQYIYVGFSVPFSRDGYDYLVSLTPIHTYPHLKALVDILPRSTMQLWMELEDEPLWAVETSMVLREAQILIRRYMESEEGGRRRTGLEAGMGTAGDKRVELRVCMVYPVENGSDDEWCDNPCDW